jgi:hypothetical protein
MIEAKDADARLHLYGLHGAIEQHRRNRRTWALHFDRHSHWARLRHRESEARRFPIVDQPLLGPSRCQGAGND